MARSKGVDVNLRSDLASEIGAPFGHWALVICWSLALGHSEVPNVLVPKFSVSPRCDPRGGGCDSGAAGAVFSETAAPRGGYRFDVSVEESDPGSAGECAVSEAAAESVASAAIAFTGFTVPGAVAAGDELHARGREDQRDPHRPIRIDGGEGFEWTHASGGGEAPGQGPHRQHESRGERDRGRV